MSSLSVAEEEELDASEESRFRDDGNKYSIVAIGCQSYCLLVDYCVCKYVVLDRTFDDDGPKR